MKDEKPKATKAEWCWIAKCVYRMDLMEKVDFSNPLEVSVRMVSGQIDRYTDPAVMADLARFYGGIPETAKEAA